MPRKGENIYKRKDGRWEGRYIKSRTQNGKALYGYVYAHTYHEVKQKLLFSIQTTHAEKPVARKEEDLQQTKTFGELADLWMQTIKPQIKESTYVKYKNSLSNYILPVYGECEVFELTFSSLETYAASLLEGGGIKKKGLSTKTIADILAIIRAILNYGNQHGYAVSCLGKRICVKQAGKELSVLTALEQERLIRYLLHNNNQKNLGLLLCLFTGIRVGEICALRWEDISLAEKQLYIHATMQRLQCEGADSRRTKIIVTTPKSRSSVRIIPLPEILVEYISKNYENRQGYVLTNHTMKYVEPRTMQNHFKKVLRQCGIRTINYHALRHTFATRCVELGFDIKSLSEILGHANVNITMNRYVHPSMELKRNNMNKLADLFSVK